MKIHGYLPNPAVQALMRAVDVLLMPSFEEGFPRVLLEAMAAGLPFVATDVGGVAMIVPEALRARLVKPGDVVGFSDELVRLTAMRPITRQWQGSVGSMCSVTTWQEWLRSSWRL